MLVIFSYINLDRFFYNSYNILTSVVICVNIICAIVSIEMDKRNKKFTLENIIDFVTNADDSELSDLSEDEETSINFDEIDNSLLDVVSEDDKSGSTNDDNSDDDDDDNVLLSSIAAPKKHVYRWRKNAVPVGNVDFIGQFSPPPEQLKTPFEYFSMFFPESMLRTIVENTNLYSVQKGGKNINTTLDEIKTFIGMRILMGIIKLPSYRSYWSGALRYPSIADAMSRNRFEVLSKYLHFVDNDSQHDNNDKLFKIKPILIAVRNECIKIEPEEHHSIDEQIIPSKTKFTKIRQYNPKKPCKWGFKNLVRAGASGFMYDFYLYSGRELDVEQAPYSNLQKSAQVVAKLCIDLPRNVNHKVFFDNWFTTVDLMRYLKREGILAVGTIRGNRVQGCPLVGNKEIGKGNRGDLDYRVDNNSGVVIVKWLDNSVVQLCSNFIGVEPMDTIQRWDRKDKTRKDIQCPQIVKVYNKSMGGVDLADMLIALYRTEVKTRRWYIKVFWHLVDIAKVNGWILYRRHYQQYGLPRNKNKSLLIFSQEIAEALIMANKVPTSSNRGRPSKRKSVEKRPGGKKPAVPLPCHDVRYDCLGHWPIPVSDKKRCRLCHEYSRINCEKCNIYLCLNQNRNCFREFHTA